MADQQLTFRPAELYGGAITVDLPVGWIDASDIRQVPSHQEVHLSHTSNTNLVFEINQYVTSADTQAPSSTSPPTTTTSTTAAAVRTPDLEDKAALLYHLHDLLDDADTLTLTTPPRRVALRDPALAAYPAWRVSGNVEVRTPVRRAPTTMEQVLAGAGDGGVGTETSTTRIHLLVVRLRERETDLCVVLSVPEEKAGTEEGREREERGAGEVMERVVRSLRVGEWDLFG